VSRYRFPTPLLLRIALAVARARPRSLGADAAAGLRGASPPPLALDTHYLPASGPFVVVGNHYERPGLWAGWGAMIVSAAVRETGGRRRELHWLMTDELLELRLGPLSVSREWIRAVFARFARVYGFGLVSAREAGVVGGAGGIRVAARYLAAGEPVGVLPEGTASVALCEARPGVGALLAWLTRDGTPLVPVGVAERDGVLTARFGPPFQLPRAPGDKMARDRALRDAVMVAIARLLPPELWGHYRAAVEEAHPSPPRPPSPL
jgi:1-acyl-sn-glycerol-3-phosphate acyltransferase